MLGSHGIEHSIVNTDQSHEKRTASIRKFTTTDNNCSILVIRICALYGGMDLTCANQIVICDACLSQSIEDRVVGTIRRRGQSRVTHVHTLTATDSFEHAVMKHREDDYAMSMSYDTFVQCIAHPI